MATPSQPAPATERSGPITTAFRRGVGAAAAHPLLALLPLLTTLTAVGKIRRVAAASTSFQFTFGLPQYVGGLWTFVNAPTPNGVTVFGYPAGVVFERPAVIAPAVTATVGGTLLVGLLAAAYLGTLDRALADEPAAPLADLRTHAPVTVGFVLLELVGGLAVFGVAALLPTPIVVLPLLVGSLVALYLLGPVPYVGVATDCSLRTALVRGVDLAGTRDWLLFVLAHAGVAAICSPVVSGIAFAGGLPSVLVAAVLAAPLALVLNAATMAFVRDAAGHTGWAETGGPPADHQGEPTSAVRQVDESAEQEGNSPDPADNEGFAEGT
jgi:hypothetical protein